MVNDLLFVAFHEQLFQIQMRRIKLKVKKEEICINELVIILYMIGQLVLVHSFTLQLRRHTTLKFCSPEVQAKVVSMQPAYNVIAARWRKTPEKHQAGLHEHMLRLASSFVIPFPVKTYICHTLQSVSVAAQLVPVG